MQLQIQANLSIDKCGGADKLPIVIEEIKKALKSKYPNADITVRKGYFQTIDGIWASEPEIEYDVITTVNSVREQVLENL